MKPVDFTLHRPDTLDEAVAILAEHRDEAKVLAGGQSLVPLLNFRLARPEHLVDLSRIASLTRLVRTRSGLAVGAMVRQAQAERSAAVAGSAPLLAAAFPHIAHQAIRARGTVGGSLAHADPAAELPAVAVASDARFTAVGPSGRREIAAADFFLGNLMTALAPDEVLTEVVFSGAPERSGAAVEEVGRRRGDFALVCAGAQVSLEPGSAGVVREARVCLAGVAATPYRAAEAERVLAGARLDDAVLAQAADAVRDAIDPNGDLHATAGYRKDVAGVLVKRAVAAAHRNAHAAAAAA